MNNKWTAENYLQHHGIKGQKWGVRRFQNPDGTLTALGKQRYGNGSPGSTDSKVAVDSGLKNRFLNGLKKTVSSPFINSDGSLTKLGKKTFYEDGRDYNIKYTAAGKKAFVKTDGTLTEAGKHETESLTGYTDEEKALHITDPNKLADKLKKETDFSHIKDKNAKAKAEQSLMDKWYDEEEDMTTRDMDLVASLFSRIRNESYDWYESDPKTAGTIQLHPKVEKIRNDIKQREKEFLEQNRNIKNKSFREYLDALHNDKKRNDLLSQLREVDSEINGQVLKDLGYEDTPKSRELIHDMIRWD